MVGIPEQTMKIISVSKAARIDRLTAVRVRPLDGDLVGVWVHDELGGDQ